MFYNSFMVRKSKYKRKKYRRRRYGKKKKLSPKFKRKVIKAVNQMAETKISNTINLLPFRRFDNDDLEPGVDIVDDCLPAQNTTREGRVGVQIFVKSVMLEATYGQDPIGDQHLYGLVTFFFLTERSKGSHRPVSEWLIQVMNGFPNSFEPSALQLYYSKVKRYDFRLGPQIGAQIPDNEEPANFMTVTNQTQKNFIFFRKKFKYNKVLKFTNGESQWPSTYMVAIRWAGQFTRVFGIPGVAVKLTMRFTDV